MKFKHYPARYIPGLKHYKSHNSIISSSLKCINIPSSKKRNYKTYTNKNKILSEYRVSNFTQNKPIFFITNKSKLLSTNKLWYLSRKKLISLIIGVILIIFGIINIISNTIVYTPMRFMNSLGGGVNFAITSLSLLIGVFILFTNKKRAVLGFILIAFGLLLITISIFFSLKMGLLPMSLLKVLLIFGSIFAGTGLIIRSIIN